MKGIATFLVVVAIGAAGYFFINSTSEPEIRGARGPLTVSVKEAKLYRIHDEIEALGTAFANEAVNITANTTDKITEILFDDGDVVKKGQIIVRLDSDEEKAEREAELSQVAEHERELKRLSELLKRNATAKNEYDERKTLLEISISRIDGIEARIEDKTIRAPFDGLLGLRKISVGSLVEPGDLITTIDDITQIKLDFFIPSTYLDVVRPGLKIKAKSEALEKVFSGEVTNLSSRVDPSTRAVEVRALLPNPEQLLKPGILLGVTLFRNEREAIVLPEQSTIQLQNNHYIYVIEDKKVNRKPVQIGKRGVGWVEITSGLELGEQVMIEGHIRVRPGDEVNVSVDESAIELGYSKP